MDSKDFDEKKRIRMDQQVGRAEHASCGPPDLLDLAGIANRRAVQVLAGAAIGMSGGFAVMMPMSLGIYLKPLVHEFGWSRAQASLIVTFAQLGMTIAGPFFGLMVRHIGARRVLILGYTTLVSALLIMSQLAGHTALFAAVALGAGLGAAITTPGGIMLIVAGSFDRRLALASGCAMTGLGIGSIIVPVILSHLISAVGWREAFAASAAISACLGAIAILMIFQVLPPACRSDQKRRRLFNKV